MYEVVWSGHQPHPWHCGIISTPQVNLNPQIWRQLGRCKGIRVQPYALETAYPCLKHFGYVYYGCMQRSKIDISLKHEFMALTSQIWGQLCRCNGIRVHPYALGTAYQWLKHFAYVYYGCMKQSEVDISLKHDVVASFPLLRTEQLKKLGIWLFLPRPV